MKQPSWLELVTAELRSQKLPPRYVARLLSELSDHFHDFMEDRMSTDAKDLRNALDHLGRPEVLARQAAASFKKPFSQRHPLLTFALLPIVMLPLLWSGLILTFIGAAKLVKGDASTPPEWLADALPVLGFVVVLVPILVATAIVCRLAHKAHVDWKWLLLGCALLSLLAGMAMFKVTMGPDHHGSMSFGLGLGSQVEWTQVLQFALPLTIGGWFIWRRFSEERQHVLS